MVLATCHPSGGSPEISKSSMMTRAGASSPFFHPTCQLKLSYKINYPIQNDQIPYCKQMQWEYPHKYMSHDQSRESTQIESSSRIVLASASTIRRPLLFQFQSFLFSSL
jgi:hypothetical protein